MSLIYQGYAVASCNGKVRTNDLASWDLAKAATVGRDVETTEFDSRSNNNSGQYGIYRGFMVFDTSTVPAGSVLLSGTLRLYWDNQSISDADTHSIYVVQSTQSSTSTLSVNDMANVTLTSYGGSKTAASFVAGQNVITLTSTGLGYINAGGYTKLAIVTSLDYNNTQPSGINAVNTFKTSTDSDDSHKPLLTLTYTIGSNRGYIIT